ncbi:MAG: PASTA domain-containing protein [Lachnospiraceae bacterium]|nr:PASTA domain-containing protein [Lachnospiraceae bacterium]
MKRLWKILCAVLCISLMTGALVACGKDKTEENAATYVMPNVIGMYYMDAEAKIRAELEQAGFTDFEVHTAWYWGTTNRDAAAHIDSSKPRAGTVIVDRGKKVSITLSAPELYQYNDREPEEEENEPEKVLVVVFSVTGHTKNVAQMIAEIEDADLYEIIPAEPYTDEDIDYKNNNCRALKEQYDASARPAIGSEKIDLSGYTKIYIGYPIWAGSEPRIMDTFVESYDFGSITVIPFCTSGSSGIGTTGTKLATLAGSGNWETGKRFPATATKADIQAWIDSMK